MGHVSIKPRRGPNPVVARRKVDQKSLSITAAVCIYCRHVIPFEEKRTRAVPPLIGPAHPHCVPGRGA